METNHTTFRRIVTGHDAEGKAIITADGAVERTYMIGGPNGAKFHEVWSTYQSPALIDTKGGEPEEGGLLLAPPKNGTRIRVIDFPPEGNEILSLTNSQALDHFKTMGGAEASKTEGVKPHPLMHRTQTVDYGIVLDGELTLIVDRGETTLHAGDIVIQRGTNHAWANRTNKNCRVVFILIDGKFEEGRQ